ncbi:hypothetical protein N7447_008877 [Penicillium robsamsonii]|uniref:uncharacterized protein n=1 Tax=Penicillium robsamsonii TaxID=1792511 RepID=UPI00254888C0|nr:uncharacterized protein N7447_008877 [Penicillium robsamsonii]KAJ5816644.1 hypothetical protein N7447_008877 [Penicillium robsamsonii]
MADDEERIKAEKLAAAKKRVAQLQKKKKAKKTPTTGTDTPKEAETPTETEPAEDVPSPETLADAPAEEKPDMRDEPAAQSEAAAPEQPEEAEEPNAQLATDRDIESPTEPMPPAPTSPDPEAEPLPVRLDTPRAGHGRQPSLSIQSKMRSSSFRKTSRLPSPSATIKSPAQSLPPLTGDGESVHEVFRKQSTKIEELEKDNKRLEKDLADATLRWRKTEEQVEDLRDASVDGAELKEQLKKAEEKVASIESLKEEIASLQRQNSQLQTRSHRNTSTTESPPADLVRQLESKSATIESMELEISNLRAQVASQTSSNDAHESQVAALEEKVSTSQSALDQSQRELADTKQALTRASEKAVKEGVDKTSTETLISNLQREIEEHKSEKSELEKKIETLDKKVQAIGNLHKETEARHQTRLRESEKSEKEISVMRKKIASIENENLRLREESDRIRTRQVGGGADDDALDELEDEERQRLERRIRELEGEVFDLRRGVWQEKRQEMEYYPDDGPSPATGDAANAFDDVDLVGGRPDHARRRSMAQNQHSSFSTVLSSGFAAFTGAAGNRASMSNPSHPPGTRGSLELVSEENFDDEFDEDAFARAQAEEEGRKRVEWMRDIKSKLRDWNGWRLDLVDSRAGAEGAGVGMGEIFEV